MKIADKDHSENSQVSRYSFIQFWKQVFTMQRKNPSRMVKYMGALFIGHTLYRYSTRMLREFIARQQKEDSQNRKHGTDKNASSLVNEAGP